MSIPETITPDFLASDEELSVALDQSALPAPSAAAPPSVPERVTPPASTDATPPAKVEQADATNATDATPERTTYPKGWKGTEGEWQEFRAEQNTRANRERDARQEAERVARAKEDEIAFFKAQIVEREAAFQQFLTQAYGDPERAQQILDANRSQGNQRYWSERQEREALAAQQAAEAARQQTVQSAAAAQSQAQALAIFNERVGVVQDYAAGAGVTGLDLRADLEAQFASAELAPLVRISNNPNLPAEELVPLMERIYATAVANVKATVDGAKAAKEAAAAEAAAKNGTATAAGRATALGSSSTGANGTVWDFSEDGMLAELDAHYKARGWGKVDTAAPAG